MSSNLKKSVEDFLNLPFEEQTIFNFEIYTGYNLDELINKYVLLIVKKYMKIFRYNINPQHIDYFDLISNLKIIIYGGDYARKIEYDFLELFINDITLSFNKEQRYNWNFFWTKKIANTLFNKALGVLEGFITIKQIKADSVFKVNIRNGMVIPYSLN